MFLWWCYFHLPTADLGPVNSRTNEYTAISIGFLLESQFQDTIVIGFFCRQVPILFIGPAFANHFSILNIPFFRTMDFPTGEVFVIEDLYESPFPRGHGGQ